MNPTRAVALGWLRLRVLWAWRSGWQDLRHPGLLALRLASVVVLVTFAGGAFIMPTFAEMTLQALDIRPLLAPAILLGAGLILTTTSLGIVTLTSAELRLMGGAPVSPRWALGGALLRFGPQLLLVGVFMGVFRLPACPFGLAALAGVLAVAGLFTLGAWADLERCAPGGRRWLGRSLLALGPLLMVGAVAGLIDTLLAGQELAGATVGRLSLWLAGPWLLITWPVDDVAGWGPWAVLVGLLALGAGGLLTTPGRPDLLAGERLLQAGRMLARRARRVPTPSIRCRPIRDGLLDAAQRGGATGLHALLVGLAVARRPGRALLALLVLSIFGGGAWLVSLLTVSPLSATEQVVLTGLLALPLAVGAGAFGAAVSQAPVAALSLVRSWPQRPRRVALGLVALPFVTAALGAGALLAIGLVMDGTLRGRAAPWVYVAALVPFMTALMAATMASATAAARRQRRLEPDDVITGRHVLEAAGAGMTTVVVTTLVFALAAMTLLLASTLGGAVGAAAAAAVVVGSAVLAAEVLARQVAP